GDLFRCGTLLVDRRRDGRGDLRYAADGRADRPHSGDRVLGGRLHAGDLRGDLLGRLAGLGGERLDLGGHHREAAAGLAGARCLAGGVEREQVGLRRDVADQLDHVADAAGRQRQLVDAAVGLLRLLDGVGGDLARLLDAPADLVHRGGDLLGGRRDGLYV